MLSLVQVHPPLQKESAKDVETNLRNLNTDMIDIYFCHDISREENYEKIMSDSGSLAALKEARKAGKIRSENSERLC